MIPCSGRADLLRHEANAISPEAMPTQRLRLIEHALDGAPIRRLRLCGSYLVAIRADQVCVNVLRRIQNDDDHVNDGGKP